ncbi:MAG: hypothetical protein MAG431_02356 [Chloroflexi bacterium]|nr:hypothetical protein [Chloroflexota bacterium]
MARLWIGLMISGLIYLGFTVPFPLHGYYATTPPVDYAKLTNHSLLGFLAYVAGIGSLFGLYTILWRTLAKTDLKIRFVLLSGTLLALILVFSYPQTAIDLFVYAIRTRGWARYGLDPFSTTPDVMPISDPWLGLAGEWVDAASPYGPIWEWLSLGTFHASGGGYLGHLFALKILSVLAYGGSVWLLYRILLFLRPLCPQWAVAGAAFFAWNPLVLLEGVQNAHNDLSMVFFFLLATWGFLPLVMGGGDNHKILYAGVFVAAFAASILVKFIPLLLLPFFFLGAASRHSTWLRWIASGVLYGLAILLLVFLVMAPYWPGAGNWAVLYAGKSAGRSLMALMILALRSKVGTNLAFDYVQASIYAVLAGIYFWNLWRVGRQAAPNKKRGNAPGSESIIESIFLASFNVLFWYILIGASTFHAWYLLWILPLAALFIPDGRPARAAVVFSMVSLLIIPYYETIRVWFPLLLRNHLLGHIIGVALLFIPTLSAKFCQSSRIKINH